MVDIGDGGGEYTMGVGGVVIIGGGDLDISMFLYAIIFLCCWLLSSSTNDDKYYIDDNTRGWVVLSSLEGETWTFGY